MLPLKTKALWLDTSFQVPKKSAMSFQVIDSAVAPEKGDHHEDLGPYSSALPSDLPPLDIPFPLKGNVLEKTASSESIKPHYYGHRQRLKERFLKNPQVAHDYEVLELLLYLINPRRDVKPLAKNLLKKYGTLAALVEKASQETPALHWVLTLMTEVNRRMIHQELHKGPLLNNSQKVIEYCHLSMAHLPHEEFHLFFLDKKFFLLHEGIHRSGTLDQVPLYPREVLRKALDVNAASLIMVHNHPSGDPSPSRADKEITRQLAESLLPFSIRVLDHFIIAKQGYFSFRENGLL